MTEAIDSVKSGQVTYAIKDTEIEGVKVKKDEFMAIYNTKEIIGCHKKKIDALKQLLKYMVDEDSSVITVLLGEDISTEKDKAEVEKYIEKTFKDCDFDIRFGKQPVYSYIVGVE
jgi:dihydroxyacetone kinase-like predicted kinase